MIPPPPPISAVKTVTHRHAIELHLAQRGFTSPVLPSGEHQPPKFRLQSGLGMERNSEPYSYLAEHNFVIHRRALRSCPTWHEENLEARHFSLRIP